MTTHLSVRLTWHDSAWNGCVCREPACNVSCVQHQHVRESRKLDHEKIWAGTHLSEMEGEGLPPCSRDTAAFAERGYTIEHRDPLAHRKLPSTLEGLPAYTCCPSPYRWMREENLRDVCDGEGFTIRPNDDGREAGWVYEPDRQRELLQRFWGKIERGKSLVFYYLNQANPLSERETRILVGVGRIKHIGDQHYFGHKGQYTDDYPVWSRAITQAYPEEGVRLPYQEYLDSGHDVAGILCPVPAGTLGEFSYVAEHVNDDVALSAVERVIQSVERVKADGLVPGDWDACLEWLDKVLQELWADRGAFPGIGSVLQYLGFRQGTAYQRLALAPLMKDGTNIWRHTVEILEGERVPADETYAKGLLAAGTRWRKLTSRKPLLAFLARFEVTPDQVERIANPDQRMISGILSTDDELLANPYLICEQDIGTAESEPVALDVIDHGLRPEGYAALFPPEDEIIQDDPRRVRAIAVDVLKQAATAGDSLLSMRELLDRIRVRFSGRRECRPDSDLIEADAGFFHEALAGEFGGNEGWCALKRLRTHESQIAERIKRRTKRTNKASWEPKRWEARLHAHPKIGIPATERETLAIQEKLTALETLLTQRVSVLTGGAGTGKTTVLKVFLDGLEELEGRQPLLLLAPTGKARVRLGESTGRKSGTIHQFLLKQGWCDPKSWVLKSESDKAPYAARTVVIDECSMIPADVFGTLLDALDMDNLSRLILVGDPNQLPPIGPGRPFADITNWLKTNANQCIAQLDTCMRTEEGDEKKVSTGLELANSYRANNANPSDDELLSALAKGERIGDVEVRFWNDANDMMRQVRQCFREHLDIAEGDYGSFSASLGAGKSGIDSKQAESWQILSPTRRDLLGTDELNRLIQEEFKGGLLAMARNPWKRNVPSPFGDSEIVWTDKVLQVVNQQRRAWPQGGLDYVANGEIGLVENTHKGEGSGRDYLQVRYSTQSDFSYRYYRGDIGVLELAYALTVHKAQGSDFDVVYLIVPQTAATLTRELIYTGLTRFRRKLVLLIERDIKPLLSLRHASTSDVENRNSFVFDRIMRGGAQPKAYADNLIHRAKNGERMRSKSEVIVANILLDLGLNPRYEVPLYAQGSKKDFRLPDFTVSYEGDTYYWEHLGMLSVPSYREAWARKEQWYKDNGYWEFVITSEDRSDGGIDASAIEKLARSKILLEDE